jgi:hypothetical protein
MRYCTHSLSGQLIDLSHGSKGLIKIYNTLLYLVDEAVRNRSLSWIKDTVIGTACKRIQ